MSDETIFRIVGGSLYVHEGGSAYLHSGDGLRDMWKKVKGVAKETVKEIKNTLTNKAKEELKKRGPELVRKYKYDIQNTFTPDQIEFARKTAMGNDFIKNAWDKNHATIGLGIDSDSYAIAKKPRKPRLLTEEQLQNLARGREIRKRNLALKKSRE